MCTPAGRQCFKSIKQENVKCKTPCKGVFADVEKNDDYLPVEDMVDFEKILYIYKKYKAGFKDEKGYTEKVAGIFIRK